MTVKELKSLLKGLPNDMMVIMPAGENVLLAVCREMSEVRLVEYPNSDPEEMLLLVPCSCSAEEYTPTELNLN